MKQMFCVSARITLSEVMEVIRQVREGFVDLDEWSILDAEHLEDAAKTIREWYGDKKCSSNSSDQNEPF